jgi:hypothetical protein
LDERLLKAGGFDVLAKFEIRDTTLPPLGAFADAFVVEHRCIVGVLAIGYCIMRIGWTL